MKSLFLQAPSFDGYDGGAGARYQMKREVKSFWFPTWLAQAAAMVPGSKLTDAPPHNLSFKDIEEDVTSHEFDRHPHLDAQLQVGLQDRDDDPRHQSHRQDRLHRRQGRGRTGREHGSLQCARFCRPQRYDFTIKELAEGAAWSTITGLTYRNAARENHHEPEPRNPGRHGQAAVGAAAL